MTCVGFRTRIFVSMITGKPEKEILWAAENGDLELVKKLTKVNTDLLHVKDKDGYTPLHRACYSNHVEIVDVSPAVFF